jgi:hypothetical protein
MVREVFARFSDHLVAAGYGIAQRSRVRADSEPAYGASHDGFECARLWAGAEAGRHEVRTSNKAADDHQGKDYSDVSQERLSIHAVAYCFGGIIDRLIFGSVRNLPRSAAEQK